jgi:hypothetical protein
MTALKMVLVRRGKATGYMDPTSEADAPMFEAAIRAMHGKSWRERGALLPSLLKAFIKIQ